MNTHIIRKTLLLQHIYQFHISNTENCISYQQCIDKIETLGYELCKQNYYIKGVFKNIEQHNNIIITLAYILKKYSNIQTIHLLKIEDKYFDIIFQYMKERYTADQMSLKQEIQHSGFIIIDNSFQAFLNKNNIPYTITNFPTKLITNVKNIELLNNSINQNNVSRCQLSSTTHYIRNILLNNYKEILCHHIINYNNKIHNKQNKLHDKFLSHNYIREYLYEAYIFEYHHYQQYQLCFEIGVVYNIQHKTEHHNVMLAIHKTHNINTHLQLLQHLRLINRYIIYNNKIYNIIGLPKAVGIIKKYKQHYIIEVRYQQTPIINLSLVKQYDINIMNFNIHTDTVLIYINNIHIYKLEQIDCFQNKYTVRIYTILEYITLIRNIKLILQERLLI